MAMEKRDLGALKRNVIHLLLQYPQGVSFGDFSGAYYQLHGCYPRIALHGYQTLRELVADMKNVVIVEGSSLRPVMKIANGFHLDNWLEGDGENELEASEGEAESLIDEGEVGGETALAEVLDLLVSLLRKYSCGLRINKVQKFMRTRHGIDMEKFSIARGYRDILEFLEHQMPGLKIRYPENNCNCLIQIPEGFSLPSTCASISNHVKEPASQAKPELSAAFMLIQNVLKGFCDGIKVKKLENLLRKNHGFDLETFCSELGYEDVLSCLQAMPGLFFRNMDKNRNCVVQLQSCPFSSSLSLDSDFSAGSSNSTPWGLTRKNSGTSSPTPSLDTGFSAGNSRAVPEKLMTKKSDLAAALVPILNVLGDHPLGMDLETLRKDLQRKHGFDLDAFCQRMGYEDVMSCLLHVPGLCFSFTNGKLPHSCVVQLLSASRDLPHLPCDASSCLDKPLTSSGTNIPSQESVKTKPASCSSTPSQSSASLSLDMERGTSESETLIQNTLEQKAASGSSASSKSSTSLSLDKQQVISRPNVLEENMVGRNSGPAALPSLLDAPVQSSQPVKMLEPVNSASGFGDVSKPSVTTHDSSASKSPSQSLSLPASSMSRGVKNGIHPSIHIPLPVVPHLLSFQEAHSVSSPKASNSRQSASNGPPQKPSACNFGRPPPAEEVPCQLDRQLPSTVNVAKGEPSKDQDDLKQQVAHILAQHPEGMSLFQFRVAYSATYQRHLPLGNAASAKQLLLEMPDVVHVKNYGVQTQLLPVSSVISSVKSDQPVSSTVENSPEVPGHSVARTVSVIQLKSEEFGAKGNKEGGPFPEPQLQKAPKPRVHVQECVKMSPTPVGHLFIPQSPVVYPTYPQTPTSCENLKPNSLGSKPTQLTNPCISGNRVSVPSTSQPASHNHGRWAQPVVCPYVPFVFHMPGIVPFLPVSKNPSGILFQNTALKSSPSPQPPDVLPVRYVQTTHLTCSTGQHSYVHTRQKADPYSAVQKSSTVLPHAWSPAVTFSTEKPSVSSPSRSMSQTVHQLECYNHTHQDGLQQSSFVVTEKRLMDTHLDREPKLTPAYLRQCNDGNSLMTSASTMPFSSHSCWSTSASLQPLDTSSSSKRSSHALPSEPPANTMSFGSHSCWSTCASSQPLDTSSSSKRSSHALPSESPASTVSFSSHPCFSTSASLQPLDTSSSSQRSSDALPSEPPASMHQQQHTSANVTMTTSSRRLTWSPPSLLDSTASSDCNPAGLSGINNNSATQTSDPQTSIYWQRYSSSSTSEITFSKKPANSSPYPQDSAVRPSCQLSTTPLSVRTNYEAPVQAKTMVSVSRQADRPQVSLPEKQASYYSPPQKSPPAKSFDKCVIL